MVILRKLRFGFLEKPLSRLCYKHSRLVAAFPWPFIIVPLVISTVFGVGYFFRIQTLEIFQLYTPTDGLSLTERETVHRLFPEIDGYYTPSRSISWDGECDLLVSASDDGSVLRPEYLSAIKRLNEHLINHVTVRVDDVEYGYRNICLKFLQFCHTNPHLYAIDLMLSYPEPTDNFTYPVVKRGMRSFYVAHVLADITMDPLSRQIVEAKTWRLVYQVKFDGKYKQIGELWEREYEKQMLSYNDPLLKLYVFHSQSLDLEIRRNSETFVPKFVGCLTALFIFASICAMSFVRGSSVDTCDTFYVDWARSKPTVAAAGLMGAVMGIATTVGLMRYCGFQYDPLIDAMPFVVIGVRLDNTFLMMSAIHQTKRSLPAADRVAKAMSEAAVSITITVLTDILSFAVGIWTDFYAVQLFCLYIMLAMIITFAYQLTFLLGVIVLSVRAEERNAHTVLTFKQTVPYRSLEKLSLSTRLFCLGTQIEPSETVANNYNSNSNNNNLHSSESREDTWISSWIKRYYAPFLTKTPTRICVLILYICYLTASIIGCGYVRQGLDPSRLLLDDSYCKIYVNQLEETFWKEGVQSQIVFENAGDLADPKNRRRINDVANRFAYSKHGMGEDGMTFWLRAFQHFEEQYDRTSLDRLTNASFYKKLDYFLSLDEHAEYRNDIVWSGNGSERNVTSFRLMMGMKNFSTSLQQIDTVDDFRRIASLDPYYRVSTFQVMWLFVDQYEEILPNTLQEIYGGVSFMILIAVFFIPSVTCTFWVVVAILSIDAGAIGLMTFWGINLDVISMITIITSIGFSVDFTAHIAYAFVANDDGGTTAVDKTAAALGSLAWPITQGAISTTMGVVALAGGNSYIMQAFFKTIFIVMTVGLLHALVFLPVVLSVLSCKFSTKYFRQLFDLCCRKSKKISSSPTSVENDDDGCCCCSLPKFPNASPNKNKETVVVAIVDQKKHDSDVPVKETIPEYI